MAEIRLSAVTKRFGRTLAVDAVSLTVADGEFMVFVGPSGCGKSTTLRMVAGLETVSEGVIHIGERDVTRLQPKDRNIAMVFQNYALYAHKNVFDNLGFGLRVRGARKAEIEKRVRHAAFIHGLAAGAIKPRTGRQQRERGEADNIDSPRTLGFRTRRRISPPRALALSCGVHDS